MLALEPSAAREILKSPETMRALAEFLAQKAGLPYVPEWRVWSSEMLELRLGGWAFEISTSRGLTIGAPNRALVDELQAELYPMIEELGLGLLTQRTIDELYADPEIQVTADEHVGAARVVRLTI